MARQAKKKDSEAGGGGSRSVVQLLFGFMSHRCAVNVLKFAIARCSAKTTGLYVDIIDFASWEGGYRGPGRVYH